MNFVGKENETRQIVPLPRSEGCKVKERPRCGSQYYDNRMEKPWDTTPFEYRGVNDGKVREKDVILCRENWKPAVWACGPQNFIRMRRCHKWGAGMSKTHIELLPNNYRILNTYKSNEFNETKSGNADDRPVVVEMANGTSSAECMKICAQACCSGKTSYFHQ